MIDSVGSESRKQLPVEGAVVEGFQNIVRPDFHRTGEIRQGPRDFQNPVMRAGGELHFLHRVFKVAVAIGAELAVLADLARAHE